MRLLVEAVGIRVWQLVTGGKITSWIDENEGRQLVTRGKITGWIDENEGVATSN